MISIGDKSCFNWHPFNCQVKSISGHLYYRHDGSDNLVDSFDFKFRDFYGLESEVETMHIRVSSKDMLIRVSKKTFLIIIIIQYNFQDFWNPVSASLAQERMSSHCITIRPYSKTLWMDRNKPKNCDHTLKTNNSRKRKRSIICRYGTVRIFFGD